MYTYACLLITIVNLGGSIILSHTHVTTLEEKENIDKSNLMIPYFKYSRMVIHRLHIQKWLIDSYKFKEIPEIPEWPMIRLKHMLHKHIQIPG